MKIDKTLISIESWILSLHNPVFAWLVLLDIARERGISQNEAFEVLNGIMEDHFRFTRYSDVRSLRRAAFEKSNKLLPTTQPRVLKFAEKVKIMTFEEADFLVFDENSGWDGQMTEEIASALGLSDQWQAYEEAKKAPPRHMTREELERIREEQNAIQRAKYPHYKPPFTRQEWENLKFKCEGPND